MIQYIDRKTGQLCVEKVYGEKLLALLYGEGMWSRFLSYTLLPLLAHLPLFSRLYGWMQKKASSRAKIKPFIEEYRVDEGEFETKNFTSFNDFFTRKLKASCRPIVPEKGRAALPADGRYLVYPRFETFEVKNTRFTLDAFLQDLPLARRFSDGSLLIARLCPVDYHRFHFPCDGKAGEPRAIKGPLFSVNPIALKKRIEILAQNKRVITEIETEAFGTLLYVEIGATAVGTVQQTFQPNTKIKKGDEKGYFEFGGSCLALLFEKGAIEFDEDLVRNTERGFETLCRFGDSMGRCKAALHWDL
jgi:phosphatidylserine decarboxylase